eukprot:g3894.t1
MAYVTTKDGVEIFYKDWGPKDAQPIVFHHGWPLSSDDWDAQMLFFLSKGYRVVAHDRRGHGRSTQVAEGHDMDHYAADAFAVIEALDLKNATHIGHSTGGGEVARYVAKHGQPAGRVAKAVLVSAVPPLMLKTQANPEGLPIEVFDGFRSALAANRAQFFRDVPSGWSRQVRLHIQEQWEERTMMKRLMLLALTVAAPLLGGVHEAFAEIGTHTIKFAGANSKGHPQVTGMEKFAELVKEKSGGKITVNLYPGGALGGDLQTVASLQGGVVEMLVLNAGLMASSVKAFGAVDLPFLFSSGEEADKVMDGAFGKSLEGKLAPLGLVGLGYWELGFRNLTNSRRPIEKLEDIKGLKIRTLQAPIPIALFTALGANAVPMPYPELYPALETGAVDGQENPYANILNAKFFEVQKYLTVTRHQYNPQIVLISKMFWDRLNQEEQQVLQQAATEARDFQRKVSREADSKALEEIKATGMQVTTLSDQETQKLRDAVKPLIEKFTPELGSDTVELLFKELEAARR